MNRRKSPLVRAKAMKKCDTPLPLLLSKGYKKSGLTASLSRTDAPNAFSHLIDEQRGHWCKRAFEAPPLLPDDKETMSRRRHWVTQASPRLTVAAERRSPSRTRLPFRTDGRTGRGGGENRRSQER
ncbi:unnamed protein product [Merluccius merluccius]